MKLECEALGIRRNSIFEGKQLGEKDQSWFVVQDPGPCEVHRSKCGPYNLIIWGSQ